MEPKIIRKPKKQPVVLPLNYYRDILAGYFPNNDANIPFEALNFAYEHHAGCFRKSGEPYLTHPVSVAEILMRDLHIHDPQLISAALLHDVVEDVPAVTLRDIERRFGTHIAGLVDGCTKLQFNRKDRATQTDLTHSKIFLSASRQLGVLLIKLADRLHNMQTLASLPEAKRRRIALETLRIYAPIAAKLNLYTLKRQLYNLALLYLFPRKSKKILSTTKELLHSREAKDIEFKLQALLSKVSWGVSIRPRVKGLGSCYSHLKQTLDLSNTENLVDFTVVLDTDDPMSCYSVLGLINQELNPVPKSIRDFIANPKQNGYNSLHVRINQTGRDYLVKIRTRQMDLQTNSGLRYQWDAIHLQESYWSEISDLLRNIGEYAGNSAQRKDLIQLSDTAELFVYTPDGDIHYLPRGSVVLDFAYKIHSDLGKFCAGAEIAAKSLGPGERLKDGATVKILQSSDPLEVDSDLEKLCKTPKARSAINKLLQSERQEYAKKIGKEILLQEMARQGLSRELLEHESMALLLNILHIRSLSQMYIRIGQDDNFSTELIPYYFDQIPDFKSDARTKPTGPRTRNKLRISELQKAVHKFSKCCKPYPGQPGVVAALSERGVAFHRESCRIVSESGPGGSQRLLDVIWDMENSWHSRLWFNLRAKEISPQEFIRLISPITFHFELHHLQKAPGRRSPPSSFITVTLSSFQKAASFFKCFPPRSIAIRSFSHKDQIGIF